MGCSLPQILYNRPKILGGGILEPLASGMPRYPSLPSGSPVLQTRTRSFIRLFSARVLSVCIYIMFLKGFLSLESREKGSGAPKDREKHREDT